MYRDFDQAELNRQYDAAGTVPDVGVFLTDYHNASEHARATLESRLYQSYGPSGEETLDVFPSAVAGSPTFVFIHGGYWRRLHKDDFSFVASALVPAGVSVVVVNYALAPNVQLRRNRPSVPGRDRLDHGARGRVGRRSAGRVRRRTFGRRSSQRHDREHRLECVRRARRFRPRDHVDQRHPRSRTDPALQRQRVAALRASKRSPR